MIPFHLSILCTF